LDTDEAKSSRLARIARIIDEFVSRCARHGYQACLHNEVGTAVAKQETIDWALESTPVALRLDTGHLVATGGDPLEILERWRTCVSHVHLKDVHAPARGRPYEDAMALWKGNVFCRLNTGAERVDDILSSLRTGGTRVG
jgi:inosose dehydratase